VSILSGRVLAFGADVDTDVMMPGKALRVPVAEARRMLFEAIRPGFADQVRPGDVIVGGVRFGTGSARPVAMHLRPLGVTAIVAESMSSLFQRGAINAGVLAVVVPGVTATFVDGDQIEIDDERGTVRNPERDITLQFPPIPALARSIIRAGGIIEQLVEGGFLPAEVRP
jgi:3-isopropylmalate/(R)-2-methylmalate dehydratase small subunit